jgi:hypothetical protein
MRVGMALPALLTCLGAHCLPAPGWSPAGFRPRAGLFYQPRLRRGLTVHELSWIFAAAILTGALSIYREYADFGGAVALGVMMLFSSLAAL